MRLIKTQRRQRGFSLIELIAVILVMSIIAITAASRYFAVNDDATIAVLQKLAGDLNQKVTEVYVVRNIPGRVSQDPNSNNLELVSLNEDDSYLTRNGYLHAREVCHVLGLTDRAANRNGSVSSDDGRFSCKDENRFLGTLTIDGLSRDQCYIHYNTRNYTSKPFATVTCRDSNSSECICPGN